MQSEVMRKTCFARQKDLREVNEFFSVWWSEFSKFTAETSDRINPNRWKARGLSFPPMRVYVLKVGRDEKENGTTKVIVEELPILF